MLSDNESEGSLLPNEPINPFTIAKAQSVASSGPLVPAKYTRHREHRRPIAPKSSQQRRRTEPQDTSPAPENPSALANIPIFDGDEPAALEISEEDEGEYVYNDEVMLCASPHTNILCFVNGLVQS